ncbi:hypothetical protein [Aeromonas rivipollensis]|nr:hypothetical protein [Aeromonas rivipollensis]
MVDRIGHYKLMLIGSAGLTISMYFVKWGS